MSYKPEVQTDNTGNWYSNTLRFATEREANMYALDLSVRWTAIRDVRVVTSEDDVTARVVNNRLELWNDATRCNRCHAPLQRDGNGTCACGGLIEETGWNRD